MSKVRGDGEEEDEEEKKWSYCMLLIYICLEIIKEGERVE